MAPKNYLLNIFAWICFATLISFNALAQNRPNDEELNSHSINNIQKININMADADELTKLPGIGATKAKRIIAYREELGAFRSIEQLTEIKGIGPSLLQKMANKITLD